MDYLTLAGISCQDTRMLGSMHIKYDSCYLQWLQSYSEKREGKKAILVSVSQERFNAIFVAGVKKRRYSYPSSWCVK